MRSPLLPETTPPRIELLISCQVLPQHLFNFYIHRVPVFLYITQVDKWRVVLKGENPDYIHATNIRVSTQHPSVCLWSHKDVSSLCRATSSREHSSSHRGRCAPLPETSGRWSTAGSVVWSSCYQTSLNRMR